MVNKEKAANIAALNDAFRQQPLAILPRHDHPLQPRLRIIAARPVVKDGDAKPAPPIAVPAPLTRKHANFRILFA